MARKNGKATTTTKNKSVKLIAVAINLPLYDRLSTLAKGERRPVAQMHRILLEESVKARESHKGEPASA